MAKSQSWWSAGVDFDFKLLERFHDGIRTAQGKTDNDAVAHMKKWEASWGEVPSEIYDWGADERSWARDAARVMYAGLAVAVASLAENTLAHVNRRKGVVYLDKKGKLISRPDWGIHRQAFENRFNVKLDSFTGYPSVHRARLLANSFKHRDGKRNAADCAVIGGRVGSEIEYERQPWDRMLRWTRTFLKRVVSRR